MKQLYAIIFVLLACLMLGTPLIAQGPGYASFKQAENMRKQNRLAEAVQKYEEAINLENTNYKYYFNKGKAEYQLKDYAAAKESFKQTVNYRPEYTPAYTLLAKLARKENPPNTEDAIYYYEQAVKFERSDAKRVQYNMLLVNLLLKENRTYDARRYLEEARRLNPDNPQILYYTAEIAAEEEDWNSARADYERALESDKLRSASDAQKAKYFYGLGLAHSKLGDMENAKRAWAQVKSSQYRRLIQRELSKNNEIYYYKIAISYYLNGEYEEADRYLDKSLELQRDFARAYILKGKMESKQGNGSRAVEYFERAIDLEDDPARKAKMYGIVAKMQLRNDDSYGAISSVERAISLGTGSPSVSLLYMRAKAEYQSGRYRDAISSLQTILSATNDPKAKARYNFLLGMASRRAGESEAAEQAFRGAMFGPYKPAASVELENLKGRNN
ncbi:MAG: tetratricopeptide repeat protein [Bacteroidia bacterium]